MTTNEMAQKGFNTGFTDADGNELHVGDYVRLCGDIGEIVFSCGALTEHSSFWMITLSTCTSGTRAVAAALSCATASTAMAGLGKGSLLHALILPRILPNAFGISSVFFQTLKKAKGGLQAMSYGFSMGFAQAKDLSEAMNLALEYVGMRMEPKRVTEELKRNIYYVPTIRARYVCDKNVPYSQRNMQLENLADMADRYWVKNLFSYRFLYWQKQQLLGIVMMKDEDISDKWPLCVYFQNSTDQNYPYSDWEVGSISFFTDAISKAKALTLHDIASLHHDMDEESFGAESLEYQQRSYCYKYISDTLGLDAWLYGSKHGNVPYKCFELNGINSDIELFRCHTLLKAILEKENPI